MGIGADLQHVALDPKHPHRLASEAEILEMMTDFQPPGEKFELSLKKRDKLSQKKLVGIVGVNLGMENNRRSACSAIFFQLNLHFESILFTVSSQTLTFLLIGRQDKQVLSSSLVKKSLNCRCILHWL